MLNYQMYEGRLGLAAQRSLFQLYETIFGNAPDEEVIERLSIKNDLLLQLVVNEFGTPVAFKLGYQEDAQTYYSWLGGVLPDYRRQGISGRLMREQHEWCVQRGYTRVRTKTRNQWREMLVLNIRSGFDIVSTYTKEDGVVRIVMEKVF